MIEAARTINKKLAWGLLACLAVYAVVRSLMAAAGKPFRCDELLTLVVSSQGGWKDILAALYAPLDGQPPLFCEIEHFALSIPAHTEVALRLPSILALPCTLICAFLFVRRRRGETVALLCALFLLMTSARDIAVMGHTVGAGPGAVAALFGCRHHDSFWPDGNGGVFDSAAVSLAGLGGPCF